MGRVGLIALSIALATMLLVGASYGAVWLQPYVWHVAQQGWFLPLVVVAGPGLCLIAQRLRRRRAQN